MVVYRFEDCELDEATVQLRVGGERVQVEPQVYDLLRVLLHHRDRVVTREELLDEVWHHRFVTESAVSSRIKSARRAIGDDGRTQRLIRTVHGRGYQFVGDVTVDEPPDATGGATPVPQPTTQTIGRTADVAAVLALLDGARIVTLLGPGGVGKTRLAVEVARRWAAGDAVAGARFVDLTKVREADLVPELIVRELGVHVAAGSDAPQALREALRGGRLLLVLDNFEHVVGAAPVVGDIVRWAPDARVLTTSRARLRVAGERVYDVPPLAVDGGGAGDAGPAGLADAVALFDQAARAVDPSFDLDAELVDVAAICRAVDGLPLAIELAAGHVRTLPPVLLRTRLTARLGSPLGAARDAPGRQRTVPATIDWSLQLLGPAERALFARLGVFVGQVPLDAVEQVCAPGPGVPPGEVVDALTRLVDQSLVRRTTGTLGEPRYVLLELLREHARELLAESGEAAAVEDRHAGYVAAFLDDLDERRWTDLSDRWIDLVTEVLGEIRAAHAWAERQGEAELAARIVADLGTYWHREGHHAEGRRWVYCALEHADRFDPLLAARLHLAAGFVEWPRDQTSARVHWEQAAAAFRGLGHDRYLAYALMLCAGTYIGDRSRYDLALGLCDDGIDLARHVGEKPLVAQGLNIRGELTRVAGDDGLALAAYEEGRDLAAATGDEAHLSVFLANLAYLADHRGDYDTALRLGRDALRLCWSLGRRMMAAWTVSELAGPELGLGRAEHGARLVGAADEALRVLGLTRHPGDVPEHARVVAGLRVALGDDAYRARYEEGGRLSLDEAVALALSGGVRGTPSRPPGAARGTSGPG
ncbi:MAG TPA: winged helix-turn-helix domain-containing protein [Acidimicrobiales bacterium]